VHVLRGQQIVPIHVSTEPADGAPTAVYAITDSQTAARLDDLGFWVDRLGVPDEPQHTAAYLVRDDLQEKHGFLELVGNARTVASGPAASSVLASTHKGLLVALSSATPLDSFHFSEASEGHIRQLSPSVTLLQDGGTVAPRTTPLGAAVAADPLTPQELRIVGAHFAPATLQTIVDRYAGAATGFNTSRHVQHPGNRIAVDDLVADLGRVAGLTVQRHNFSTQQQAQLANVVATLGATSNMQDGGIVIVSAHLDSTAAKDGDAFDRATSPAPGADDDGSGMATVLEAAAAFADLAAATGRPHREVRFVLFNCEEEGKAGSDTYAKAQAALKAQISAVFHVDMIGFTEDPPTNFEVHAAFGVDDAPNRADASARTGELGALIEQLRPALTSLPLTQLITSPDEVGAGRSDHASFHAVGFPACWVTEDFFPDEPPASKLNPNYHTSKDRTIDADYAAQIARLVGAAAWIAATR
jgi:hypothetical protein